MSGIRHGGLGKEDDVTLVMAPISIWNTNSTPDIYMTSICSLNRSGHYLLGTNDTVQSIGDPISFSRYAGNRPNDNLASWVDLLSRMHGLL